MNSPDIPSSVSAPLIDAEGQVHPWLMAEAQGDQKLLWALLGRELALEAYVTDHDESHRWQLDCAVAQVAHIKTEMGINPLDLP